jgi:hypothetical protein
LPLHAQERLAVPPLEAVVDIATGVGKTYVLASAIEYLAQDGVGSNRNLWIEVGVRSVGYPPVC